MVMVVARLRVLSVKRTGAFAPVLLANGDGGGTPQRARKQYICSTPTYELAHSHHYHYRYALA